MNSAPPEQPADVSGKPEKRHLTLGFIPLTDCAPLAVAQELGLFARHGLIVRLSKEASWANIRDKVAVGVLDGAHMLAAIPIAMSLGVDAFHVPMTVPLALDLNGNAITVSTELYRRMGEADPEALARPAASARALKSVIEQDRRQGRPPRTFAMVFPFSSHNYQLRYWLASAGIDPDRDVRLVVVPPPQMAAKLQAGHMDGYCVGEPWNSYAVAAGIGHVVATGYDIWNNSPEKVFSVTREWAERYPRTLNALIQALLEACRWLDRPENRVEAVRLIAGEGYVDAPEAVVGMSMAGTFQYCPGETARPLPDFNVFHRYAANFPWLSHAEWFITQMWRWGQIVGPVDIPVAAAAVYRPDLYRQAATELDLPYPIVDRKTEGWHAQPWVLTDATRPIPMGPDRFCDGQTFSPAALVDYVGGLPVAHPAGAQLGTATGRG